MVLTCQRCGKKFFLPSGEQSWLQVRQAKVFPTPTLCVDCEINLSLKPVFRELPTRSGRYKLTSAEKVGIAQVEVLDASKLKHPKLYVEKGIRWEFFSPGRTYTGSLSKPVLDGDCKLYLNQIEKAPFRKENIAGARITIFPHNGVAQTRAVTFYDGESDLAIVKNPFCGTTAAGTRYNFFGMPEEKLPNPLCDSRHNMRFKREAQVFAEREEIRKASLLPRAVKIAQDSTILCDTWGPPCKTNDPHDGPVKPYNCVDFLNAIVRFAQYAPNNVLDKSPTWGPNDISLVLAFCSGAHPRLGKQSSLLCLHSSVMRRIAYATFPMTHSTLPAWSLLSSIRESKQIGFQRPCSVTIAPIDEEALKLAEAERAAKVKSEIDSLKKLSKPPKIVRKRSGSVFGSLSDVQEQKQRAIGWLKVKGQIKRIALMSRMKLAQSSTAERLFVVDHKARCVHAYSMVGELERSFGESELRCPEGVAVDHGRVLVADSWLHCVHIFTCLGESAGRFGTFGRGTGQFDGPTGIATHNGCVYVCDTNNHRVQVLRLTVGGRGGILATVLRVIGAHGWTAGRLDHPAGVAVSASGNVAVTEPWNARAQIFDASGRCVRVLKAVDWAGPGGTASSTLSRAESGKQALREADASGMVEELGCPYGVAFVPGSNHLMITDIFYHRVLVFDAQYRPVQKFGSGAGWGAVAPWAEPFWSWRRRGMPFGEERWAPEGGDDERQLHGPLGVSCGAHGHVAVCDTGNSRVQLFV